MVRIILICLALLAAIYPVKASNLEAFLRSQPEIVRMEKIEGNQFFNETWKIMVRQPLDYKDTTKGFFVQRVFVADKGVNQPTLLITEGYGANYAALPRYINELSKLLNSNQITVEHRYFGESVPQPLNWKYLTTFNANTDHHRIAEMFKKYYSGKWINTGISKGGQTAVYHRYYYPRDVDVTVAYVGPLNFGVEDGRHEPFIRNVPGTPETRQKIENFQLAVLKNRKAIMPKLEEFVKQKNYTFSIPLDQVLDFCVLEYSFSLWQWGTMVDKIPDANAGTDELFKHLMIVASPSYFAIEDIKPTQPFFVQAARELGYYGYDTKPFSEYLSIKNAKGYLSRIFLPEGVHIRFSPKKAKKVNRFVHKSNEKILFIYGQFDPWSATAFTVPDKPNYLKIVKPGGSHSTRIGNLPADQKTLVLQTLGNWLGLNLMDAK